MKNLLTIFTIFTILIGGGLACKNNPFSKFTSQYKCSLTGEPEPKTADDFVERGWKHIENSEDSCAFDACSDAINLDSQNAGAYACRGVTYKREKRYDLALSDFDKAISLDADNSIYLLNRSALYEDLKQYDKAIGDINTIKNLNAKDKPGDDFIYASRGRIYLINDDFENAAKDFTDAIGINPNGKILHNNSRLSYYELRAEAYRKLGKYDLAEADEIKANELEPPEISKMPTNRTSDDSTSKSSSKTISGGVLNGKATNLVKPPYPAAARAVRASGAVTVQVTVDEQGNVISASAVSGHPLLRASAVSAARASKFSPTLLAGKPVKVTGVIIYNFVPE